MRYILLAVFGLAGLFARYFFNSLVHNSFDRPFYISTIIINIVGSFLMGVIYVAASQRLLVSEDMRIALMVGFLGSFTTFSAFSIDTIELLGAGNYWASLSYTIGSTLGSILACYIGVMITRRLLI